MSRKGIIEKTITGTANKAYKSNPDGCLKVTILFWVFVIVLVIIVSSLLSSGENSTSRSGGKGTSSESNIDRSSSASSYIMNSVRAEISRKYTDVSSIRVIKTVRRGSQQHYTTYGEFNYKKGRGNLKGRFEAVSLYNNATGTWSSGGITIYPDTMEHFY